MSLSSIDSNYSLMASYSFQPVQKVRSVGAEEVPFTMPVELEEENAQDARTSSIEKNSTSSYNSDRSADKIASEISTQFFRTSPSSNDTTGIEISPEMQNFLAHLPDSQKPQLASMQADRSSLGNTYQDGNYKANVENANKKVAEGSKQAEPLLNNVGLLMSQNPVGIAENSANALQAQNNTINYTAPAVEPSAVQSIAMSGSNNFISSAQIQQSSAFSTNSLFSNAFSENNAISSSSNQSARRMNQAMKAYAGLY